VQRARLFLNHDAVYDWLIALEFGRTDEGQPLDNWDVLSDAFAYLYEDGYCLGFVARNFAEFDSANAELWDEPRFDAPALGLRDVSAGEVLVAARVFFGGESSINRQFFDAAISARRAHKRVDNWLNCLQAGDVMAHYGLGYTLYDLGRYHEAYRHLRAYTELAPCLPWAWCWFGKAAESIGETAEAEIAYRRALELEDETDDETEAAALLDQLLGSERP
jgi:tetratricopeptide (TPR) repeat protein